MSPEQTRGDDVDYRSGIFSLGCVLYEAATGRKPFQSPSALSLMHQIATLDPESPETWRPDLPPGFNRLVMRCLAKNREQRPDSTLDIATELKALTLPTQLPVQIRANHPRLAVLPLNLRGPEEDRYLSVALAEGLIHRLSSLGKLVVRPIAAVMRYAGKDFDWSQVARELNVDLVVEGSVQIMGGKIRVLLQAHRAADARTLASIKQDGELNDPSACRIGWAMPSATCSIPEAPIPKMGNAPEEIPVRLNSPPRH